jgi:glycosyltransferase involved in cell wall biosynthesis
VKISIALCTYNGVRFLDDQLTSLVSQSRHPDEVVVCDDCSTDSSVGLLEEFAAAAPFPVHIHENPTRLGSTKNFERAISLCQGDAIALCDQDDIWDAEKLHSTEELFVANPNVGLVFTDAEIVDARANPLGYNLWETLDFDKASQARIKSPAAFGVLSQRQLVTGATMAFRTEFRDLILPIPLSIGLIHDGWIALMISLAAAVDIIDRPMMKYRQHDTQQVGALLSDRAEIPTGILERAKIRYSFAEEIKKLELVRERVQARKDRYKFRFAGEVDHRLNHMRKRVEISQRGPARIASVFGELLTGRYHRYSNGFYSVAKDLIQ